MKKKCQSPTHCTSFGIKHQKNIYAWILIWMCGSYKSCIAPSHLSISTPAVIFTNPYGKNRGAAHFAARGLHVGNGVGCPWAAHGNFAMQILIRLPTTSIYGNSGQLSRLPTTSIFGNSGQLSGQLSGQRFGLPMGILPCKLGCPLLPYMETVGSSVGSQLHANVKKVGSAVGCPWEFCHANKTAHYFHIRI